jgi:ferredoxin
MDGILAMEGEGPGLGRPRRLGLVLASRDAVALDAVAGSIVGFDPDEIDTTRFADERGLGAGRLDGIEVVGEALASVAVPDFRRPSTATRAIVRRVPPRLAGLFTAWFAVTPWVVETNCTGCTECTLICPTGAASMHGPVARIDHELCIECMCCHEVCRYDAVVLRRSLTSKAVERVGNAARRLGRR